MRDHHRTVLKINIRYTRKTKNILQNIKDTVSICLRRDKPIKIVFICCKYKARVNHLNLMIV